MEEHSGNWGLAKPLELFFKHFRFGKGRLDFANAFFLFWNLSVLQGKFNPCAFDLLILKASNYFLETINAQ